MGGIAIIVLIGKSGLLGGELRGRDLNEQRFRRVFQKNKTG